MQLERNAIKNPIKNDRSSSFTLPILECLNKKPCKCKNCTQINYVLTVELIIFLFSF